MGFLREQLGEDELRALLDRLNAWTEVIWAFIFCFIIMRSVCGSHGSAGKCCQ